MNKYQEQLINECTKVLAIKDSEGWQVIQRDAQANFDAISNTWFNLQEGSDALKEARARQIANHTILNLMGLYEDKLNEVGLEVIQKESPDLIQTTDVDNGIEEPEDG